METDKTNNNNNNNTAFNSQPEEKAQGIDFSNDSERLHNNQQTPDGILPEDDPALINPDELATFPKEVANDNPDIDAERDSHLVNRRSPVRDGRNITRTDTTPDNDGGFM
jgi:hypothetical protein